MHVLIYIIIVNVFPKRKGHISAKNSLSLPEKKSQLDTYSHEVQQLLDQSSHLKHESNFNFQIK